VRYWDWAAGKETGQRGVPASATHAVFAADGQFAFAADHGATLCGADGKMGRQITAGHSSLMSLALSPDGALVATRSWPYPEVHLWDAATLEERCTLGKTDRPDIDASALTEVKGVVPADLVFSPDGGRLAGAGPTRQLCLWAVPTGALVWQLAPEAGPAIERFAFSANGLCLATVNADHTVTLYDAATGARRGRLGEPHPNKGSVHLARGGRQDFMQMRRDVPVCLAFSPDGRYLATAKDTPEIHLWDVLAGREVGRLQGHEGGVVSLLFAPDGKHLFSGGTDTTALSWDVTRLTRPQAPPAVSLKAQALDSLWNDLAGNDAIRAFDAIRKLSASPDQAVALFKERLRPVSAPDPKRLARLLADLQSDSFAVRRGAELELGGLGELAEPALRRALAGDPPVDLRQRVQRILDKVSGAPYLAGQLRDLRAVELLELIGSAEARRVLAALAEGAPGARLTQEAKRAAQRLSRGVIPE
jgi:WD40 repeat protein